MDTDAISSSNNQAFNATIPANIGNTSWTYGTTVTNTAYQINSAGYHQMYTISMPFSVSKIKLSFAKLAAASKYGWYNRSDRNLSGTFSSQNYTQGTSVDMAVNNQITLMKANTTYLYYEPISHVFKLYQGYLSYGIDATKSANDNSGVINLNFNEMVLNIIAYR